MFSSNTSQVSNDAVYIEDVFSTWLYTGNGNAGLTINNGIDLSGKGGLTWLKKRSAAGDNYLYDTARGASNALVSNTTAAAVSDSALNGFTSTGFTLAGGALNATYASWTFRKQPKFFDVVTYTGDGVAGRQIAHSLASVPGFIVVKRVDFVGGWPALHRNDGTNWRQLFLNSTNSGTSPSVNWFGDGTSFVAPTSTNFTVGANSDVNASGWTYVAYLFAHNAGGFGLTGTDNVISCGSFTSDSTGFVTPINLGYEPQFVLIKRTDSTGNWYMFDNMRGVYSSYNTPCPALSPNTSAAESNGYWIGIGATGFDPSYISSSSTYIYIAIRRGPMKTPTSGTSVFQPVTYTGDGTTTRVVNTTITPDAGWFFHRNNPYGEYWFDRLRGGGQYMRPTDMDAEASWTGAWLFDVQNAVQMKSAGADYINGSGALNGLWAIKRAPGFFDEVCYTTGAGTGQTTFSHNLGVTPELIISKTRSAIDDWYVYAQPLGTSKTLYLTQNLGQQSLACAGGLSATSATTYLGVGSATAVSYLFASCPGVSKVGSYTGTGSTQTIDCGFTGGARFVMIKRTDSTGDWYVWDTARGMVAGTDPSLRWNFAGAEVNANSVYTTSVGFQIVSTAAGINASGGSYIYLAIA